MSALENVLSDRLLKAVKIVEEQLDQKIEKFDKLSDNELNALRAKRIAQMKAEQQQKQEWLSNGHGVYEELPDERSFFNATKQSKKLVCHFYLPSSERCKIFDMHLKKIATKHLGTRFVNVNADKFPFSTKRLNIRVIPTLASIIDSKTVDYLRGFDDLGACDTFRTETLEWRLSKSGVIDYDGPSYLPGSTARISKVSKKKSIRSKADDDDDDFSD